MTEHETGDAAWGETTTPPIAFASGPWRLELRDDELADVSYDGRIVLRSIRGVARDQDWGTLPPVVTGVSSLHNSLRVDVALGDLSAQLTVEALGDELDVRWTCHVHTAFLRNRLGLVALHPPTLAGEALEITHPEGDTEASAFPVEISAHQPAFDISALGWDHDGLAVHLEFTGDVFEMEDQRNWTDASFKTYSTPLELPFPVEVAAGSVVEQGIRISARSLRPAITAPADDRIELVDAGRAVPSIGTSASTGSTTGRPTADFLLVELPVSTPVWPEVLDRAVAEAGELPLDVRIVGASADRIGDVIDAIAPLNVIRVGVFSADTHVSEPELWHALGDGLASRGLGIITVGGTRAHFTELNRTLHRLPGDIAEHTFSVTPEMHATGREQLVESIAMQRLVAENAGRLTEGPVHVGPVTLRARFNAVATTPTPDALVTDLSAGYGAAVNPDATDPRHSAPAILAWTVASAAALSVDGVASITWFEASGPRSASLDWLTTLAGAPLLEALDAPAGLWAIGARSGDTATVLVANLRPVAATVTVAALGAEQLVELEPYAAARIALG